MYEQLKLDNQLCFRFYAVSRLITQAYGPLLSEMEVTYPQYLVLLVLWERDGMPVNDIAKKLLLNTNTVTPLLKRMEEQNLVKRTKGVEDGRQVVVSLTPKGKALEEKAKCVPIQLGSKFVCEEIKDEDWPLIAGKLDSLISVLSERGEQETKSRPKAAQ